LFKKGDSRKLAALTTISGNLETQKSRERGKN